MPGGAREAADLKTTNVHRGRPTIRRTLALNLLRRLRDDLAGVEVC